MPTERTHTYPYYMYILIHHFGSFNGVHFIGYVAILVLSLQSVGFDRTLYMTQNMYFMDTYHFYFRSLSLRSAVS